MRRLEQPGAILLGEVDCGEVTGQVWATAELEPGDDCVFCRLAGMQPIAKNVRWEPSRGPTLFLRAEIELAGG